MAESEFKSGNKLRPLDWMQWKISFHCIKEIISTCGIYSKDGMSTIKENELPVNKIFKYSIKHHM